MDECAEQPPQNPAAVAVRNRAIAVQVFGQMIALAHEPVQRALMSDAREALLNALLPAPRHRISHVM